MNYKGHVQQKATELCEEYGEVWNNLTATEHYLWTAAAEMNIGPDIVSQWTR